MSALSSEINSSDIGVYYRRSDYAGFWRRFCTDVIDITAAVLILLLLCIVIIFSLPEEEGISSPRLPLPILPLLPLVAFGYFVLLKRSRFRTIGYRFCDVRIVNLQGGRPSLFALTARLLFAVWGPLNFLLDLVWIPSDPDKQALRDKFAHTYVVRAAAEPQGRGRIVPVNYHILGFTFLFLEVKRPHESPAP